MRSRRFVRLVLLALLALLCLLAGCSGFAGPNTPTQTVSPAPVPTDAVSTPPGIANGRVVDAAALTVAHSRALVNRSLTLTKIRHREAPNGTVRYHVTWTYRWNANRSRVLLTGTIDGAIFGEGGVVRFDRWGGDGPVVARFVRNESVESYVISRDPADSRLFFLDPTLAETIRSLFEAVERVRLERISGPHGPRYRLVAPAFDRAALSHIVGADTIDTARLTAVLTPEGRIVRYRLQYQGVGDGKRVRGVRTVVFENVGSTTVERPPWVERALAEEQTPPPPKTRVSTPTPASTPTVSHTFADDATRKPTSTPRPY